VEAALSGRAAAVVVVAALAAVMGSAGRVAPALADDDQALSPGARAHLDRGLAEYDAKNFRGAAVEFQAAYAIDPRREILYVWAQAERLAGDCEQATILYRKFLALGPPPAEASRARARLAECAAAVQHTPAPPARHLVARRSPPSAPPWYRDGVGAAFLLGGLVIAGAGGVLAATGRGEPDARDYAAYDRAAAGADRRWWIGVAGLAAGGLLAAAGTVRIALTGSERDGTVALAIGPAGAGLMGTFW
jgi:tetratricopeptide (TPR) repeat protein